MKLGIIGCGLIGAKRAAAAPPGAVAFVADPREDRAQAIAARHGARVARDWREVVESDVDAVVVATTHDQLAGISLSAVEAGKHVLVEKPAGRRAEEVVKLAAASRRLNRIVKVGFNHRFHPALAKAKSMADAGEIGPLMFIRARYGHGGRPGYETEWRCDEPVSGGGELIDQGCHLIDLSRWFLGDLSLQYCALPTYYWKVGVDDNSFLSLRAGAGQIAWLHASWTEWKNTFSFEVFGRDGKLAVDGLGGSYGIERLTHYRMLPQMGPPETTVSEFPLPDNSWDVEFREFVAAIDEKRAPIGDVHDAVAALRIIDQAYGRS